MKINRIRHGLWLAASMALVALMASAELQNVEVNGHYSMKEELRLVNISAVATDEAGQPVDYIRMQTGGLGTRCSSARVEKVAIPVALNPKDYPTMGRAFLSFYLGRTGDAQGDVDLAVTIRGSESFVAPYRVYTGLISSPGWHPVLIDLRPWAGQILDFEFRAGWLDDEASDLILGLPRLVSSHGPYYAGRGGISIRPIYHGMPPVYRNADQTLGVDGTLMDGGPLVIARFDAIKPSIMHMQSDGQDYSVQLNPGIHWLPLQLPVQVEPEANMGCTEGIVERGPIDVIPNFMARDEERLERIVKRLDPPLAIPQPPQLVHAAAADATGP